MTDRSALLRADLARSPASLAGAIESFVGLEPMPDAVRFVGLGSSRFAALTVAAALRGQGRTATVDYASAAAPVAQDEIVIGVSSSGRTAETVAVLQGCRGRARRIAVTNDPASPLADAADVVLPLHAGAETAGVATLTYRATLAVLALATGAATLAELEPAPRALEAVLAGSDAWVDVAADRLDGADAVDVIVSGDRLGSGEQAALMLREAPRIRAGAVEAGDWLHTAVYTALPGHRAILLGPTPYAAELVETIRGRGGETIAVGQSTAGVALDIPLPVETAASSVVRALVESLVADVIAAELWSQATATSAER